MKSPLQIVQQTWQIVASACSSPTCELEQPTVCLSTLEDRVLYDATPLTGIIADITESLETLEDVNEQIDDFLIGETIGSNADFENAGESPILASDFDTISFQPAKQLLIIDERMEDIDALVDDILSNNPAGASFDIVRLDQHSDGIEKISLALEQNGKYDAIHIVAHGSDSQIQLGSTLLDQESLLDYQAQLSGWTSGMALGADILLYGCNVASTESGESFVELFGDLTGADVAASNDLTGSSALGGDWDFEFFVGTVETNLAFSQSVQATYDSTFAMVTVDVTADVLNGNTSSISDLIANDGGDGISLREAVLAANNTTGTDTIMLGTGTFSLSIFSGSSDADASVGDLDLTDDTRIIGAGDVNTIISSTVENRLFEVHSGTSVFQDLMILDGRKHQGAGIQILAGATATVERATFRDNATTTNGGAIYNAGTLFVADTMFSNNSTSTGNAGGIFNAASGILDVSGSLFVGNDGGSVGSGAALKNLGFATIVNSTFSANVNIASGPGGISNDSGGALELNHVTIAQNDGYGVGNNGTINISNSIVAGNAVGDFTGADVNSLGGNVVSDSSGEGWLGSDQINSDPQLIALADNGGRTATHAIGGTSGAVNAGNGTSDQTVDQRGFGRDSSSDAGAFEFGATNSVPSLDLDPSNGSGATGRDFNATFVPSAGPVNISAGDASLEDLDHANLSSLIVSLTNQQDGIGAEVLSAVTTGTSLNANFNAATHVLRIDGVGSVEDYKQVLRTVTYNHLSGYPSLTVRTITFVANDGNADSLVGTATVVFETPANNAPSHGKGTIPIIDEDTIAPTGDTIINIFSNTFSDPDSGDSLAGIAITSNESPLVEGVWQYSTNGGAAWASVQTVTENTALVLDSNALVRFVPNVDFSGQPTVLSTRALDSTYSGGFTAGASRIEIDTETNGGSTAISSSIGVIETLVDPINDAPSLGSGVLLPINEDDTDPVGHVIETIFEGQFSDPDYDGVFRGIAVRRSVTDVTIGYWQYSTDIATTWHNVGVVTDSSALVLDRFSLLRFVPAADYNGEATPIGGRAIDDSYAEAFTEGASRVTVDTTTNGGFTPYSSNIGMVTHSVNSIEDAPVASDNTITLVNAGDTATTVDEFDFVGHEISNAGSSERAIAAGDIDGDGDIDLVSGATNAVEWYDNDGNGNFTASTLPASLGGTEQVVIVDLDGDGANDIVGTSVNANEIRWYRNDGSQNFAVQTLASGIDRPTNFDISDIDGDGDLDIIAAANGDQQVVWFENDGSQNFTANVVNNIAGMVQSVVVRDLDKDGDLDIVHNSSSHFVWLENDGSQNFTTKFGAYHGGMLGLGVEDFDGDGDYDIVGAVNSSAGGDLSWFENDGSENFTEHNVATLYAARNLVVEDLDNDGDFDFVVAEFTFDRVNAYYNDGSGNFTELIVGDGISTSNWPAVGDFNGDNLKDIAVNSGQAGPTWFEQRTDRVVVGDVDVDGEFFHDVALVSGPSNASSFTLNGDGTFSYTHDGSATLTDWFSYNVVDSTGLTSNVATVSINVLNAPAPNSAPVLSNVSVPAFDSITEDQIDNAGETISDLLAKAGDPITDADSDAIEGIAVIVNNENGGTWQYSLDGTSWFDVGVVGKSSALLIDGDDWLRLNPDGSNGTNADIEFRAWDQTAGTAGARVNITATGGSSAFSNDTLSATISVSDVNDAPVLDNQGSMTLSSITEDDVNNNGDLVSEVILSAGGDRITDVDTGATEGIAIVGRNYGNGEWEYSTDGITWSNLSIVSDANALLLDGDDRIRFIPNGENASAPWLDVRAWDQTSSIAGDRADVSVNGGAEAFSADKEHVTLAVSGINDDPTNIGATPPAATFDEDTLGALDLSAIVLGDVDAFSSNQLTLTITASNGFLGSSGWPGISESGSQSQLVLTGTLANLNAMLNDTTSFDYEPPTSGFGTNIAQVTVHINDLGNNGSGGGTDILLETVQINVAGVNNVPVLTAGAANDLMVNEDSGFTSLGLNGLTHSPGANESSQTLTYHVTAVPDPSLGRIYLADQTTVVSIGVYTEAEIQGMEFRPADEQSGSSLFEFSVQDDGGTANGGHDTANYVIHIEVNEVNDAPVLDLDTDNSSGAAGLDYNGNFVAGNGPVLISNGATLIDVDNDHLASLSIKITNIQDGVFESLEADLAGHIGFTQHYNHTTGELRVFALTTGTVADYRAILETVVYDNSSATPDTTQREIEVTVVDESTGTSLARSFISIQVDSSVPTVVANTGSSGNEGELDLIQTSELSYSDNLQPTASVTYTVSTPPTNGHIALASSPAVPISSFTQTQIDSGTVVFVHDGSETTADSFEFSVDDGVGNVVSNQTFNFGISLLNDDPYETSGGLTDVSTTEDVSSVIDLSSLDFQDVDDNGGLYLLTIKTSTGGNIEATADPSISIGSNGTAAVTFMGTLSEINTYLDNSNNVEYLHSNANLNGENSDTITIELSDNGNTGAGGGANILLDSINVDISAVNDAPTDIAPNSVSVPENTNTYGGLAVATLTATDVDSGETFTYSVVPGLDSGNFTVQGDRLVLSAGVLDYETKPAYTVTIEVADAGGLTYQETFVVDVTDVNDPPMMTFNRGLNLGEGATQVITAAMLTVTDQDHSPAELYYTIVVSPTNGALMLGGVPLTGGFTQEDIDNGRLSYQHSGSETTSDSFQFYAADGNYRTHFQRFVITIDDVNDAPVALNDRFTTDEDTELSADVVAGSDYDLENDPLTASLVSGPSNADSFSLNADGSFTYVPASNFHGTDSFVYSISDGNGASASATVTIGVTSVNDLPVSGFDSYQLLPNQSNDSVVSVLANDVDVDGNALVAVLVAGPSHGSLSLNANGQFTYTPNDGFTGFDSFVYVANDGAGDGVATTVEIETIVVIPPPAPESPDPVDPDPAEETTDLEAPDEIEEEVEDESEEESSEKTLVASRGQVGTIVPVVNLIQDSDSDSETEVESLLEIIVDQGEAQAALNSILNNISPSDIQDSRELEELERFSRQGPVTSVFNANYLWEQIDEKIRPVVFANFNVTVGAISAAGSLGYVLWTLRGGALMAVALTQLPTWRMIDPLPILDSYSQGTMQKGEDELGHFF